MNEVVIFNNPEFGEVRTVTIEGKIYFAGVDIAKALGYQNTQDAILRHCRHIVKHDVGVQTGTKADGTPSIQNIELSFIPEGDLYRLIMKSQLPSAQEFELWVCDEVLPQIRKTGGYSLVAQPSYQIENPAERARAWAKEYEEKQRLEQKNREQADKIEQDRPAVSYYNQCTEKKINTTFRDTAKELNMSQTQLTGWLRELGYIYEASDKALLPYEPYVKSGLFVVKDRTSRYGWSGRQAYVTPKGKAHLQLLIENDGINPRSKKKHGGRKKK